MTADPLGALVPGTDGDEATGDGPLAGVGCVVKDVIDVAGVVTGAGNPDWAAAQQPASADAAAVAALRAAGSGVVAKGQCAELAFSLSGDNAHYGMPRNPAAADRDPGGSTSGPAAAVAGGLCDLGLGTDTLGSVRVPASYCGIHGYRPTHGAIAVGGVLPLAQRFDTVGVLAREAALLRRAAETLLGVDGEPADPPTRLLLAGSPLAAADPEIAEGTRAAAERIAAALGAELEDAGELSGGAPGLADAMDAFNVLQGIQVWRNFGHWVESAHPELGDDVRARIERASGFGPDDEAAAEPVADAMRAAVARLDRGMALVVPATGTVAPPRGADADIRQAARVGAGQLTCIATLSGAPAVVLPLGTAGGLPFGVSLVGAPGTDRSLLWAAERIAAD